MTNDPMGRLRPEPSTERWIEHAIGLLEQSSDALDAATLSRLNRARQAALAQRARRAAPFWLGGGLLAGACALALVVGLQDGPRRVQTTDGATVAVLEHGSSGETVDAGDDDELLASTDTELVQDLDFYAWLDAQDEARAGSGG